MNTQYFSTEDEELRKAAEIIKAGGLVAFPTETVYGLGGDAYNAESSCKIYAAKGRPSDNPLIVHVADVAGARALVTDFPETAEKLAESFWPGPLTMVLPKKPEIPDATTGGLSTVAVRCPSDEAARKLIIYSGLPIAAPSANLSGRPSPTQWKHVKDDLDGKIDGIIMGEPCIGGIESTVVDLTGSTPQILRPGLITPERITEATGLPCSYDPAITGADPNARPKAPGMKYKHYAPKAQMIIFSGATDLVVKAMEKKNWSLCGKGLAVTNLFYKNAEQAAARLFADLRKADQNGADYILVNALPETRSLNYSVMNRMLKAAGYNIIEVEEE